MGTFASTKTPPHKNGPLKPKMKNADPFQSQIIAEQRKEIARLQKLLAKMEVKKDSEIASLKAKLAEQRKHYATVHIDPSIL